MKRKTINLAAYILIIAIYSCKNTSNGYQNRNIDILTMEILKKQIEEGPSSDYNEVKYGINDFEATIPILKIKLKENGFKFISKTLFAEKIKLYFNRSIDTNILDKYLYLNYFNHCNKQIRFHPNDHINIDGSLILKNEMFITDAYFIPEILDYQKKYPELSTIEDKPRFIYDEVENEKIEVDRWRDLTDLPADREKSMLTFVHRNKYLFNDSKASLTWLLFNDRDFLIRLLVVFGYDKELKINKMTLDSIYKENTVSSPVPGQKIGNLLFVKDCNKQLHIRKGLLKYIEDNTSATDNRFIYALGYFINTLYDGDGDQIFDEDPSKKFTAVEKAEIVANIANIENPAIEKYKSLESADVWNNAASSLYNLSVSNPEVIKIIEQHNYFGLPKMKAIIAKLQEEAPPTGADPE